MVAMSSFYVTVLRGKYKGRVGLVTLPGVTGRQRFVKKQFKKERAYLVKLGPDGPYVRFARNSIRMATVEELKETLGGDPC